VVYGIATAHAVAGLTTTDVLRLFLASSLPIPAGVSVGSALYDRFTKAAYRKAFLVLLFAMGVMLVFGSGG